MARGLIILVVAAVVFWVFSVVDCAVQPATRHRGLSKRAWVALVVLLPVIGGVLWFVIGRTRRDAAGVSAPIAPDDDPAFLGRLSSIPDQDERIRQLEEELARLDAEEAGAKDDPEPGPTHGDDRADGDPRGSRD